MQQPICKWPLGTSHDDDYGIKFLAQMYKCQLEAEQGREYCIFHLPDKTPEQAERFESTLKREIEKQLTDKEADTLNFIGFHFLSTSEVREFIPFTLVDDTPTISINLNLSNANFSGVADFSDTYFIVHENFSGATFSGDAIFSNCISSDNADFSGVTLIRANFLGATILKTDLSGAYLSGADLSGAILNGTNLSGHSHGCGDTRSSRD